MSAECQPASDETAKHRCLSFRRELPPTTGAQKQVNNEKTRVFLVDGCD